MILFPTEFLVFSEEDLWRGMKDTSTRINIIPYYAIFYIVDAVLDLGEPIYLLGKENENLRWSAERTDRQRSTMQC